MSRRARGVGMQRDAVDAVDAVAAAIVVTRAAAIRPAFLIVVAEPIWRR